MPFPSDIFHHNFICTCIVQPTTKERQCIIWFNAEDFHPSQFVYDLIYWPLETHFLRTARLKGARTLGGLEMLIAQAALSYAIWTGRKMPVELVRQRLRAHFDAVSGPSSPG